MNVFIPLAATASLLLPGGSPPAPPDPVEILGNLVLPDAVYYSVLHHVCHADLATPPSPERVGNFAACVQQFLRESGYDLARVDGYLANGIVVLDINEGRLGKILIRGPGALRGLQIKLRLAIPHQVFNRPMIIEQLEEIRREYGLASASMRLVHVSTKEHVGFQVTDVGEVYGEPTIPPPADVELHLIFENEWNPGLDVHLNANQADGLLAGVSYTGRTLLLEDDRWRLRGDVAARRFESILDDSSRVFLTRGRVQLQWLTPPLVARALRPMVVGFADIETRQRHDLRLEHYAWFKGGGALNSTFDFAPGSFAALGLGAEYRNLFWVSQTTHPDVPDVEPTDEVRYFATLNTELVFSPSELRLDRRHTLDVEHRTYFGSERPPAYMTTWAYQLVLEFGWHDLWLQSQGSLLLGDVFFPDEDRLDRHVLGLFPNRYFVKKVGSARIQFRYSMARDLFKIGVHVTGVGFEDLGSTRRASHLRGAGAGGLGFHFLVLDLAQIDVYVSYGFTSQGESDNGITVNVAKAY